MLLYSMGRICIANAPMQMQSCSPSYLILHKQHNLQLKRHISLGLLYPNPCYKLSIQGSSYSYSYSYVGSGTRRIFNKENASIRRSRSIRADGGKNLGVVLSAISVPILLVLVTVIVSIIVSEKLDREFEEEIARRRAWMKRRGVQEDTLDGAKEETAKEETNRVLSPARNRPKREE